MYHSRAPARSGIAESFEVRDGFRRRTPARGRDRPQNCGKAKYAHTDARATFPRVFLVLVFFACVRACVRVYTGEHL